ncbi:MAG: helix-hairpin-helix domain-containing protein [Planctomycetota bacterium]|nr:helix-hairpin-helix domain-containing protein [Planctomycetota bacterium]
MALLCTLHADGPASLRRLREAGCTTFEDLAALEPERAAEVLAVSPSAARRLLRTAEDLRERVGEEILEREEVLHPATAASGPAEVAAGTAPAEEPCAGLGAPRTMEEPAAWGAGIPASPAEAGPGAAPAPVGDRALVERVLDRWRESDARIEEPAGPVAEAFAAAFEPASDLCPGVIDGLDEAQRGVLLEAGYSTLQDVAEGDATEIARTCGIGFSQVMRIQFLARRALAAREEARESSDELIPTPPPESTDPGPGERISLAFPPAPGPSPDVAPPGPALGEGVGGPFA